MQNPSIVVCSTAWKGTLTPSEANAAIHQALQSTHPEWKIQTFPLSDGGDGWLEAIYALYSEALSEKSLSVTGPLPNQPVNVKYLWQPQAKTAWLESAAIHGMRCLPAGQLAPLTATSYGVGEALLKLTGKHPDIQHCMISVGGSASIDGGMGFLQALGWQFFDATDMLITTPIGGGLLPRIQRFKKPLFPHPLPEVQVFLDVQTPYADAPQQFGPQKGASPEEIRWLTDAFRHVVRLSDPTGQLTHQPGTGAAGGLPFGILLGCPNVTLQSGIQWLINQPPFLEVLQQAGLIITGEGCYDDTSALGKATGKLVQLAHTWNKPLLLFCGQNQTTAPAPPLIHILPLHSSYTTMTQEQLEDPVGKLSQQVLTHISLIETKLQQISRSI